MNAALTIPAFDPDSLDAEILDAFERVRAARAYNYSFDGAPPDPARESELEQADLRMADDESEIHGNVANTLPGVAARLMLLIPSVDNERWIDRGMVEHGFLALYREVERIDGNAQQIAYAAHELIDIEWRQNLAAYERAAADFDLALRLKGLAEAEQFRPGTDAAGSSVFMRSVLDLADQYEDHFSSGPAIRRLVRTLVPDHAAYLRKVQVILAEGYPEEVAPWLARYTNYLIGRIDDDRAGKEQ